MDDAAEEGAAAVADASGVPSFCFNSTADATAHDDWASMQTIIFWVEGIGLGVCGTLGIVGNILTCVVLAKITLNNVFNQVSTLFSAAAIVGRHLDNQPALHRRTSTTSGLSGTIIGRLPSSMSLPAWLWGRLVFVSPTTIRLGACTAKLVSHTFGMYNMVATTLSVCPHVRGVLFKLPGEILGIAPLLLTTIAALLLCELSLKFYGNSHSISAE